MTTDDRSMITREQCIRDAGEKFGAILADPERRAEIRDALAELEAAAKDKP